MRLIRRRTEKSLPSDVLDYISIFIAECRNSSTHDQILTSTVDALGKMIPTDSILLLEYPSEEPQVVVLYAQGLWSTLSTESFRSDEIAQEWASAESMRGTPVRDVLERKKILPPRLWNAPLQSHDRIIGSLWLGRRPAGAPDFSTDERRIAGLIAEIVAAGFSRIRVNRRMENWETQLQSIRSMERAITSSMDLTVTLNVFLDCATTQLHADAAAILLLDESHRDWTMAVCRGFRNNNRPLSRIRSDHNLAIQASLERKTISLEGSCPDDPSLNNQPLMKEEEFSAYYATPLIAQGQVRGVLEIFRRTAGESDPAWLDLLESLAMQAAIAIHSTETSQNLQQARSELIIAYDSMIECLSRAVNLRAREAEGHGQRVSELSIRTAEKMGMDPDQLPALRRGALLHDIGKIGIPDQILWKPEALSEEEWQLMRQHPKLAEQMLAPIELLRPALDIPKFHHEWWDGRGYPYGLSGTDIPLSARIFSVVDVWDSMQARRPFRGPFSADEAVDYLTQFSGRHFDPEVVDTFLQILHEADG